MRLGALTIGKRIGVGFGLVLLILLAVGWVGRVSAQRLDMTTLALDHSYVVRHAIQDVLSVVKDAETGQRGYVLTGRENYLKPFRDAQAQLDTRLDTLAKLVAADANQRRRFERLEPAVRAKMSELAETVALRTNQGFDAALAVVLTDRGKEAMDNIRELAGQMQDAETAEIARRTAESRATVRDATSSIVVATVLAFLFTAAAGMAIARSVAGPAQVLVRGASALGAGDLGVRVEVAASGEMADLAGAFNQMASRLAEANAAREEQTWQKEGVASVSRALQGVRTLGAAGEAALGALAPLVDAVHGLLYVSEAGEGGKAVLRGVAGYAASFDEGARPSFAPGEGLVGQCAVEKQAMVVHDLPDAYVRVRSGLGEGPARTVLLAPVLFEGKVQGVIELASLGRPGAREERLVSGASEVLGISLVAVRANERTEELLSESRSLGARLEEQTEELRAQQFQLEESNAELEAQTTALEASERTLRDQQEELQTLNEELEEKAGELGAKNRLLEARNDEIETARSELEARARQVEQSSKYKSEFLANMSHELRTPLNSVLILAKLLSDNKDQTLTPKQVEYARAVYSSGNDLLGLINEVLDLAKVEAGRLEVEPTEVRVADVTEFVERSFRPLTADKGLELRVEVEPGAPASIETDERRLHQIVRNLVGNAIKFTEHGGVTFVVGAGRLGPGSVDLRVRDTGIGVAADKQEVIFEAFRQADGTTSRRFGGTGLGLTISRDLASLLGGAISVESTPGVGSTFTFSLPAHAPAARASDAPLASFAPPPARFAGPAAASALPAPARLPTGAGASSVAPEPSSPPGPTNVSASQQPPAGPPGRRLLIIEDDVDFANVLRDMAVDRGFSVKLAPSGEQGLAVATAERPDAVVLDLRLPDVDGIDVLTRLKSDPATRHIPVHIMSADDRGKRGLRLGARSFSEKPVSADVIDELFGHITRFLDKGARSLLVVEDDETQRGAIVELIGRDGVETTAVGTAAEALAALDKGAFDCMVLDLSLPDTGGPELLERVKSRRELRAMPVVVYTGRQLSAKEETWLKRYTDTIIIKDARSPERLLDETAIFLHRVERRLPPEQRRQFARPLAPADSDTVLEGKKVLVVDDDVRNIFAVTSILEDNGMEVLFAENGREGLALLGAHPEIDAVLMDVMMPEMDGYDATRAIRALGGTYKTLPVIALTAKAMKGDRERCLEAGASDYITKPISPDRLLSLLRVWLFR